MNISLLTLGEIILFNLTLVFFYQPRFIFSLLKISENNIKKSSIMLMGIGIVFLCLLFGWSFYFGAKVVIFKNTVTVH
ncbi:MAG: hypothetical protein JXA66_04480 [Oligoflexia bacterium]|nr:hypothetical protein [Oligoflexia bacterium]